MIPSFFQADPFNSESSAWYRSRVTSENLGVSRAYGERSGRDAGGIARGFRAYGGLLYS